MEGKSNKTRQYEARIRNVDGAISVSCNHCGTWKPSNAFHLDKGKFKSICKTCHSEKFGKGSGYKSPSALAKQKESRARKKLWLSELQTCTNCGQTKERRHFYNEKQKAYLHYCCSSRRSWDQIERDISEQMKTCFECGLRLPFDDFPNGGTGRDGKKPYCKCCDAARMKIYSDKPDRMALIRETGDGTLSVKVLSAMLRNASHCSHCGVELTTSYPVTRSNKTIDHNTPLSRGGKHTISNISVLCFGCNSSKQDRTMAELAKIVKKKRPI